MAWARRSVKASWCSAVTITLEQALHFWPAKPKALETTPSTASSRSASLSTTMAFLPPISQTTRFSARCPGWVIPASR